MTEAEAIKQEELAAMEAAEGVAVAMEEEVVAVAAMEEATTTLLLLL